MLMNELWKHKRDLHKIAIDADYLRQMLNLKLTGVDGFGHDIQEHLSLWNQLVNESFENLNTVYDWLIEMLSKQ